MFKSLIKRLLPKDSECKRSASYAQSATAMTWEQKMRGIDLSQYFQNELSTPEQHYRDEFYDVLFGKVSQNNQQDDLSLQIAVKVEQVLKKPEFILDSLPVLPASLTTIVEHLGKDEFDADVVVELLKNEPMIAAKVIKLANSSYYNRSNKEVTDIKSAFMQLGAYGLSKGVIDGFMSQLVPQTDLYFQHYGQQIWQHSLTSGAVARELINHSHCSEQSQQAYLIGLISNLGDIVIYQMMVEAFKHAHPDCLPDSQLFRQILSRHSKRITHAIAKHWQLPASILRPLELQTKLHSADKLPLVSRKYPVSCFIFEARIISKLSLRLEANVEDAEELKAKALNLVNSSQAKDYIHEMSV
ncbi:MAG: HDOD domain-containing protein [Psychrobium sp.]